ncbi:chitin deacetylase [Geranomyces michiganensis]|nr:chitin deacetylase [Geranomyces michiganensis]
MHMYKVSAACLLIASASAVVAQAPAPAATPLPATPPAAPAPPPQVPGPAPDAPLAPAAAAAYPNMPTVWPDSDQSKGGINVPSILASPLVQAGLARVQAAGIPPAILNLPVSRQVTIGSGDVVYPNGPAGQAAACHFPAGCSRTAASAGILPDFSACPAPNTWGITYDDGPTAAPDSPNSLDLLAQLRAMGNQKSTMFVAGSPAFFQPRVLKQMFDEGHEIAVHTWTHAALTSLTTPQIVAELLYTEAWIVRTIGVKPTMYRPPFGDVDDRVRAIATALGFRNIMWAAGRDSLDTTPATLPETVALVSSWFTAQPGFISLEHNITPNTTAKSIAVLRAVQAAGATFPLKLSPVAACLGLAPYAGGNATTVASSAAVPAATSTLQPVTSTQLIIATPKPASVPAVASVTRAAAATQPAQVLQSAASGNAKPAAVFAAAGALLAGFFYSA